MDNLYSLEVSGVVWWMDHILIRPIVLYVGFTPNILAGADKCGTRGRHVWINIILHTSSASIIVLVSYQEFMSGCGHCFAIIRAVMWFPDFRSML